MKYDFIYKTIEDLDNINEVKREAERLAKESKYSQCGMAIAIFGEDVINEAITRFKLKCKRPTASAIKTDGKTKAKIITCLTTEWFCDYGYRPCSYFSSSSTFVEHLISYENLTLEPHTRNGMMTFSIFGDATDYRHFLPSGWEEQNPEPNRVGTLSDKKLNDWCSYLNAKRFAAVQRMQEQQSKQDAFLSRLYSVDRAKFKSVNIESRRGYLEGNGLVFSYSIDASGYISQKIEVRHYVMADGDTLDNFLAMCNGTYNNDKRK